MKWMKQVFAQRFNAATGRIGHIWGDRYWSRILEGEPEEVAAGTAIIGDRPRWRRTANRDRPHRRRNEGKCGFPLKNPLSPSPSPG
jgi:hypothetical protein